MRLMLVDDEQWILDGLKLQLDWQALDLEIVCEALNGAEAQKQYRIFAPDIALVDIRMPVMDGLKFAEYAHSQRWPCTIVIMSGYADFEYAQRAMKCGVTGFLTKPVDRAELEEAMRKAIAAVRERRALDTYRYNSDFSKVSLAQWQHLRDGVALPVGGHMFAVDFEAEVPEQELRYMTRCADERCRYFFRIPDGLRVYIGVCDETQGGQEAIRQFVGHMLSGMETVGNGVVSRTLEAGRSAERYARQLELVMDSIRGLKHGEVMLEEEFEAHRNLVSIPYGSAERLIRAVGDSDEQQAQRCLEALKPFLFTSLNYEHGLLLQFLLSGMDAQLRECGSSIDRILVEHLHMVNRPGSGLSREKEYLILEDGVRRSAAYLREQRRGHGGQVVHQVQKYIDDHFDEDVNLAALAARFYIDSSQLSREFKKNVGINLNRYIRQTRLHHAAVLLSNTDMRMSDVSRRVGYDNPDYFMKLFREEYNMTPSDYRSLLDGKKIE